MRKTPKKAIHPLVYEHDPILQAIGAVFFRRSRLFFREAAFFSGGEGCEWLAQRATVGESGDKTEKVFRFYPTRRPTKGLQPSHPRLPTFCSLPYHQPHHPIPNKTTFPIGIAFSAHHP